MASGEQHFEVYKKGLGFFPIIWLAIYLTKIVVISSGRQDYVDVLEYIGWIVWSAMWQYLAFCRYIDPDLDQVTITKSESRMKKEIPIFGHVLVIYWTIYASLMNVIAVALEMSHPRFGVHRTKLTHSWFGTITRMIWFNLPIVIFTQIFSISVRPDIAIYYIAGHVLAFVKSDGDHYKHDK